MVLHNRPNDSIWLLFHDSKMCRTRTTNTWTSNDIRKWFNFESRKSLEKRGFTLITARFHRVWQTSLNLGRLYKSEAYSRFTFLDFRLSKIVQNSRTFKIIRDYKLQSRNKCNSDNLEFIRKLLLSQKTWVFKIMIFIRYSKTVFHHALRAEYGWVVNQAFYWNA